MPSLKSLLVKLPAPHALYGAAGVSFKIYRAHALGHGPWENLILRDMTMFARSLSNHYGRRPLLDHYDDKAAIYLVLARYSLPQISEVCEEWLSIRMVPGNGKPIGVSEPEMFLCEGEPVDTWMKKKIGGRAFWHRVVSSSRMCGIPPYIIDSRGNPSYLSEARHRYTSICFALIHSQFLRDYPLSQFPYRYITAMIRPDFQIKGLGYHAGDKVVHLTFTPAYRFLGVAKNQLHADRWTYSYAFPLYWLDILALQKFVNRLRKKNGKPPVKTLEAKMFGNLASRIETPISIAGVQMIPSNARKLIDRFVPDAPELKITKAADWYAGIKKLLIAAKVEPTL